MKKRPLGTDGLEVNEIGLGCMSMSWAYGKPDSAESERTLKGALEAGYDFLDTSNVYGLGHNEALIGNTLKNERSRYTLASKCGIVVKDDGGRGVCGEPDYIKQCCEESLERLQTDVIDLYYLHRPDPQVPIEESVGAFVELKEAGKIRYIGLSEVNDETLRRAHATHPITALQSEYSLSTRVPENKILASCKELGITFVPFSPLGRALQCGKVTSLEDLEEHDFRRSLPRFQPDNLAKNLVLVEEMNTIAGDYNCTLAQLSLAWVLAKDESLIPIPGTKHFDFMTENAAAADISLSTTDVERLDQIMNEETIHGHRYPENWFTK